MGGGIVIAARADVEMNEGVIVVEFDPKNAQFHISYRHEDVQPEQAESCSEQNAEERLRLFLAYKFGVLPKKQGS
jgi:hypothetical protein